MIYLIGSIGDILEIPEVIYGRLVACRKNRTTAIYNKKLSASQLNTMPVVNENTTGKLMIWVKSFRHLLRIFKYETTL